MSEGVRFTKEGLKAFRWNSVTQEYEEEQVESWLSKLRVAATIDLGVTLEDIFDAVERCPELKAFISPYSWCNVDEFHKEAKRPLLHDKSDLDYLEIESHFEHGSGVFQGFYGIGHGEEYEGGQGSYAIEFTPVNELKHLEVRLNRECIIRKDFKTLDTTKTCYSLLEVLDAIYFEISFTGSPEDRDQMAAELKEAVKEIESGEAKLVPWEEIRGDKPKVN